MKEYIKILDDLRPEEIRFNFDPLNKNLCFGGGSTPTIKLKVGGTAGAILDKGKKTAHDLTDAAREKAHTAATKTKQNVHGLATDARAELHRTVSAGRAGLHAAADQGKEWMQKLGLADKNESGGDETAAAKATPGGTEKVGEGGKIQMKEAVEAKGKKAKMGAKGKRALRKVGAQ